MSRDFEDEFLLYLKARSVESIMKDAKIINQSSKEPASGKRLKKISAAQKAAKESKRRATHTRPQSSSKHKMSSSGSRPKRTIIPKNLDGSTGLSWQEENELKRALYASLQESRRLSRQSTPEALPEPLPSTAPRSPRKPSTVVASPVAKVPQKPKIASKLLRSKAVKSAKTTPVISESKPKPVPVVAEKSKPALPVSEIVKQDGKSAFKAKVHAQRKFAQNAMPFTASPSVTPSITPVKMRASPNDKKEGTHGKKAKTEDFLTFLCLRGTDVLPPRLEFFNYPETPTSSKSGNSRPSTPQSRVGLWKKGGAVKQPTNGETDLGVRPLPKESPMKTSRTGQKPKKAHSSSESTSYSSPPPLIPAAQVHSELKHSKKQLCRDARVLKARQLTKRAKTMKVIPTTETAVSKTRLKRKLIVEQSAGTLGVTDKKKKKDETVTDLKTMKQKPKVSKTSRGSNRKESSRVNDGRKGRSEQISLRTRLRSNVRRVDSEDSEISFKTSAVSDVVPAVSETNVNVSKKSKKKRGVVVEEKSLVDSHNKSEVVSGEPVAKKKKVPTATRR